MISYNPGYQSIQKNLKHSTRQRFITIEFNYPPAEKETEIVEHEAKVTSGNRRATGVARRKGAQPEGFGP